MPELTNDLVPQFSDGSEMAVVRVASVSSGTQPDGQTETGMVVLRVVEVIQGENLPGGADIEVPFERGATPATRDHGGHNYWNQLALTEGEMLLLACMPTEPPKKWQGVSAEQIEAADAPEVGAARRCFEIEHFAGEEQAKQQMLQDALTDDRDLVRRYGVDCIERRELVRRDVGAAMLDKAIASGKLTPEDARDLADHLVGRRFFDEDSGAADATNRRVLACLSRELVNEHTQGGRSEWIDTLSSCVYSEFSEDEEEGEQARNELIRSVPNARQVAAALKEQTLRPADEEDKEIAQELLETWNGALAGT